MNKRQDAGLPRQFRRGPGQGPPMGRPVEKARDFKGTVKRLLGYLIVYKFRLAAVFSTSVLGLLFSLISPKVIGNAINKLFAYVVLVLDGVTDAQVDFHYILQVLSILAGLYVLSAFFNYIQQIIMVDVAQETVFRLRKEVNDKLSRLPLKFFDTHTHGEILSRVTNDIDNISATLQQNITQIFTSVLGLIGVIIMMLTISPLMTFIAIILLPFYVWITKITASRSQGYFKEQQNTLGMLNGHIEEMFTAHKIVKAFGQEEQERDKFEELNDRLYQVGWKAQFISGIIMPLMLFFGNVAYVLVAVVGALMVTKRMLLIGDIQAFIQYSRQLTQPIAQTANIANIIQSTIASAERVFDLLDEVEEVPEKLDAKVLEFPQGHIRFDQVSFRYIKDRPLLEDINIDVKKGQTIAIVGPTGAGKTTLVNLLMRFYEIEKGKITIDGIDIKDMQRGELRNIFGMVLQDTWLFNGTIRENIGYAKQKATEEEIVAAARAAYADHFIRTLPDGYDTVLNEEATNISQGQKQLLCIARAILADPIVLILDEATSSVDTRTEINIQKAMAYLMKGKTSFIIAHRLSTIRDADLILVMDKGMIVEKGEHKELLAKNGFYAELYNHQFTA